MGKVKYARRYVLHVLYTFTLVSFESYYIMIDIRYYNFERVLIKKKT